MGGADLGKADITGNSGHFPFVVGVAVAVHEDDRATADAIVVGLLQLLDVVILKRTQFFAVGAVAFVNFDNPIVQHFR